MEEACRKVAEFAEALSQEQFMDRGMAYHAIVRMLEIIGEAAKNIPDHIRERYPQVQWNRIGRARDIIAHHYFSLEDETLWEVIQEHVPELHAQLGPILEEMNDRGTTETNE
jgi:uncharacterized protein with HEPN domain